jgi:flagellar basal body-associated protein FliL
MKQKDIGLIVAVSAVTAIFAWVISSQVLAAPANIQTSVEVVPVINSEFPIPDKKNFNGESVNPTQLIRIGENDNNNPFPSSTQQQ